jgi:hypothetical protein
MFEIDPKPCDDTQPSTNGPLNISSPNADPTPCAPKTPLCCTTHDPNMNGEHNYSIINDFTQSPAAMLADPQGHPIPSFLMEGLTIILGKYRSIRFVLNDRQLRQN